MTSLVTYADYTRITKDTSSAEDDVLEELDAAEQLVAEYLRRPDRFATGTYTDRLRLYPSPDTYAGSWVVYPLATPVTAIPDGSGLVIVNPRTLAGVQPDGGPLLDPVTGSGQRPYATVTYTGGWTSETLPETVRREIAKAARAALDPAASSLPAGAASVRLGDAAVTFGSDGAGALLPATATRRLRRYMRRRAA